MKNYTIGHKHGAIYFEMKPQQKVLVTIVDEIADTEASILVDLTDIHGLERLGMNVDYRPTDDETDERRAEFSDAVIGGCK